MTTNELTTFTFNTSTIRVVTIEGNPWFVAADVRAVLGIQQGGTNYNALDPSEKQIIRKSGQTTFKGRGCMVISESGLYKLILRSDKPEAKAFQDWVCKVVLPAIRKDGAYVLGEEKVASGEMSEDELILKAVGILQRKVERLSAERDALAHVVDTKVNHVTVDAYRAHRGAYWSHRVKTQMGQLAAKLAADRGITLGSEERTLKVKTSSGRTKEVQTTLYVYPVALLDEVATLLEV